MKNNPKLLVFIFILTLIFIFPCLYIAYDRSLTPPPPNWTSPAFIPDPPNAPTVNWTRDGKNGSYYLTFLATHPKPNALDNYIQAFSIYTIDESFRDVSSEINDIDVQGWVTPHPDVELYLKLNKPVIEKILEGTQLHSCFLPPQPYSLEAPSLNFSLLRLINNLLFTQGSYYEMKKNTSKAFFYYIQELQFGKDMNQPEQSFIQTIISIALMDSALSRTINFVKNNRLSSSEYHLLIHELDRMEQELTPYSDPLEVEYRINRTGYDQWCRNPQFYYVRSKSELIEQTKEKALQGAMIINKGRYNRNLTNYYKDVLDASTTKSYNEFRKIDWEQKIPDDYFCKIVIFNPVKAYFHHQKLVCRMRLTKMESALRLYKLDKKKYPDSPNQLVPNYLTYLPIDPFSDKDYKYIHDSTGYFFYSIGPDGKDDGGKNTNPYFNYDSIGDITL